MDKQSSESYSVLSKHNKIPANKSLGQHFIFDTNICHKIIRYIPDTIKNHTILEVGPGLGTLTRTILSYNPKRLILVEKDTRFIEQLQQISTTSNYCKVDIIHGNALQINLTDITSEPLIIIANLPYNIGTKLIMKWLYQISHIKYIVVMLQDEVVERIIARYNTKEYGKLSAICQVVVNCKKCFKVSPKAFHPAPSVNSSVLLMSPKDSQLDLSGLVKVQKTIDLAFQTRRKKLKNCFGGLLESYNKESMASIDLENRPEQLTPDQYVTLSQILV